MYRRSVGQAEVEHDEVRLPGGGLRQSVLGGFGFKEPVSIGGE